MSVGLLLKIKTLVISTIFNNILTRSRFHFKKPLYLLILMKLVLSQVLSWNCSNSATSSYSTSNSCSLIISTASIVISFTSHESVKLIHESWNHFQTAVNVNILTSPESWMFFVASTMMNPFQKLFNLLCPDPSEESFSMATTALWSVFLTHRPSVPETSENKTWKSK